MDSDFVYIMTNVSRTLYTGVTNDLIRRVYQHKQQEMPGFTRKYHLTYLAYYETHATIQDAIAREKQVKAWRREKRVALIESLNPQWRDLSEGS